MKTWKNIWIHIKRNSFFLRTKLILLFAFVSIVAFVVMVGTNLYINHTLSEIDKVYVTNVNMNELSNTLYQMQSSMESYLTTKGSTDLTDYYRYEQIYRDMMQEMNNVVSDNNLLIMERNIRNMSKHYLEYSDAAVQAKRGRNVENYKVNFESAENLYNYINAYIYSLNNELFKSNSQNYQVLMVSLRYLESFSTIIYLIVGFFNITLLIVVTGNITKPLKELTLAANEVGAGNFDIALIEVQTKDEVAVVSRAFNKMIVSIREYIKKVKESMELESKMKEKELLMDSHLKEAQLKYLQAQINPHFLFNTLNAGAQLAMMENSEKTYIFLQKVSEFYRYNLKNHEDATLEEEIELVENYLYILNVRFSGEIHYEKHLECDISDIRLPSMILQPVVENAVSHGIRSMEGEGLITMTVKETEAGYSISIKDNGTGITKERIDEVLQGKVWESDATQNSNGIGLGNVISRLKLCYNMDNLFELKSDGINQGTEVFIYIPCEKKAGIGYVQNFIGR